MSRTLRQLRDHVHQWGGLNRDDATALLDILEERGYGIEYGMPIDAGVADLNDVTPDRIEFTDQATIGDPPWDDDAGEFQWADPRFWTRVVGPWQPLGQADGS